MKVLYILDRPNLYGSEQHVLRLISLLKDTHELSILVFNDGPLLPVLRQQGFQVTIMRTNWRSFKALNNLRKYIKQRSFDLVHAHQPKALFFASISCMLAKVPSVITIHSMPSSNMQSYRNPIKKILVGTFHYIVKGIAEMLAYRIIYLTKFSYQNSWFKYKALVVPNWIENLVNKNKIKQAFNKEPRLISVGSVTYNKGMDRLISALSLIKEMPWTIDIIGSYEESYKQQLVQLARRMGISSRIAFLGHQNNLEELLLRSDGFILLSRGETFGLVYIEAMNCGLPIIAWNIPAVREIIPEGNLILDRVEDIKQTFPMLYNKQSDFKYLSSTNHAFVAANFTAAHVKAKYIKLYAEVLSGHRG